MSLQKTRISWYEIPFWFWLIGYFEFLAQACGLFKLPHIGYISVVLSSLLLLWKVKSTSKISKFHYPHKSADGISLVFLFILLMGQLILSFFLSLKVPQLPQEYDALHYHMGIPRQHLLHQSLSWLNWSSADLWPMPVQFGMAPYWFVTEYPQKVIQWFFAVGVFLVLVQLVRELQKEKSILSLLIPSAAFLFSHGVMIQLGTAMMDIPNTYFILSAVLAGVQRRWILSGLLASVFFAAKAFHPVLGLLFICLFAFIVRLKADHKNGITWAAWKRFTVTCIFAMVVLLGRSVSLSFYHAGTPFFPIATCIVSSAPGCQGVQGEVIRDSGSQLSQVVHAYGNGHGVLAWFKHLWRVAVPSKGVNNEYDYPLGLPWLLMVYFFGIQIWQYRKRLDSLPAFSVLAFIFWAFWWAGSHQSRWLYPVLAFGWIGTMEVQNRVYRPVLILSLTLAGGLSLFSQFRAARPALGVENSEAMITQRSKLGWDEQGRLKNYELLFVDVPLSDHAPASRQWILR